MHDSQAIPALFTPDLNAPLAVVADKAYGSKAIRQQIADEGALVETAKRERVHIMGLSILSGSHVPLVQDTMARMKAAGLDIPVIVGGIIPEADAVKLGKMGVARVYTPKDFDLNTIMSDMIALAG